MVTGAAGYIGSILTEKLVEEGVDVIALDNLSHGYREAVDPQAIFIQADLGDVDILDSLFHRFDVEAVVHLAAEATVSESMKQPQKFFRNNVIHGLTLLDVMMNHDVNKLIFSSTAAVYGEPQRIPIEEKDPKVPVNAYGESKLMYEKILEWYGYACGLSFISLRYFNAAGASERFGESHEPETHLIPNVLKVALGHSEYVTVFGSDYDTKDGSCIRDYIHVLDIAQAHVLALKALTSGKSLNKAYNLGNGDGFSVFEVIEVAKRVTSASIPIAICPKRTGDPAVLIANSELVRSELGWNPKHYELEDIIESAWLWQKKHPYGYH